MEDAACDSRFYSQMDPACCRRGSLSPEQELMHAILMNAIQDLEGGEERRQDALIFFTSNESDYIFSFNSICEYFRLDPEFARNIILSGRSARKRRRTGRPKRKLKKVK